MISNARELGIDLGDDVYKQTDALEEKIIKEEILPIIKEKIEPTLSQMNLSAYVSPEKVMYTRPKTLLKSKLTHLPFTTPGLAFL